VIILFVGINIRVVEAHGKKMVLKGFKKRLKMV
jgi:hypothetical protein